MKKYLLILSGLLFLVFAGCKKKMYTCSHSNYYLSFSTAFVGFSSAELEEVVITRYNANSGFAEVIDEYTIDASNAYLESDTAYASFENYHHSGFLTANIGFDYKIYIPSTGKEFRISEIKSGPENYSWEQDHYCSMGAYQANISSYTMVVSGGLYSYRQEETNNYFLYLQR